MSKIEVLVIDVGVVDSMYVIFVFVYKNGMNYFIFDIMFVVVYMLNEMKVLDMMYRMIRDNFRLRV